DGGLAGGAAARPGERGGLRATPAPRHRHRGRASREPAAHALYHAGDLSRLRPAGSALPAESGRPGMNISAPFIMRPVATTLLTVGLALSGILAWGLLPVSPLPQVDFPTIQVTTTLPGAQPETMATSVAAALERQFGGIAGVTDMTSTRHPGSTSIALQVDLSPNIDAADRPDPARDRARDRPRRAGRDHSEPAQGSARRRDAGLAHREQRSAAPGRRLRSRDRRVPGGPAGTTRRRRARRGLGREHPDDGARERT